MGKRQNLLDNCPYREMWDVARETLVANGLVKRGISDYFENYNIKLPFLFRFVLRCSKIGMRLISYESRSVAAATLSQMEKPAGSSYFCDLTFFIRPSADLRAPIFHSDALDPMVGVKGMFEVDLYNFNQADVNIDDFLGDNISKIKEALELAEPYQKTPEQGRGKYSAYIKPYMCKYRIELAQPDAGDVEALRKYCQVEMDVFKLYSEAYISSLYRLKPEKSIVENNKSCFDKFIEKVLENDFAAKTGKKIFKDDFQKYFHEGCWRTGYYGENIVQ